MLPIDEQTLQSFKADAEKLRDQHLECFKDLVLRYTGNQYRADGKGVPTPENYGFGYVAFSLPQLVFERPTVAVSARRAVKDSNISEAVELAINSWIGTSEFERTVELVVQCSLMGFGVTKTSIEVEGDTRGMGLGAIDPENPRPTNVVCDVIAPGAYFRDPLAVYGQRPRFEGHKFSRDLEDLKNDPRYDQTVTAGLQPNDVAEKMKGDPFDNKAFTTQDKRGEVTLVEMFIPEHRKLITLVEQGKDNLKKIREVEYYGPKEGPYRLWGIYAVPGQVYPLSPLAATFEQFLELQDHATAASTEAQTFKSFVAVQKNNAEDANEVNNVVNGGIVKLQDVNSAKSMTLGGTSPDRLNYIAVLRERLDRVMGYSDAQRGMAAGGTATESTIAQNNSDLRIEWMRRQVRKDCAAVLYTVGWYLFSEGSVVMPVSRMNPVTGQPQEFLYIGGFEYNGIKQEDQDWAHYRLEIEPYSMQRVDNSLLQKRAQDVLTILPQMLPIMMQFPQVNWRQLWDWFGETVNVKNFSKTIFGDGQPFAPLMGGGGMMPPGMPGQMSPQMAGGMPPMPPELQQAMAMAQGRPRVTPQIGRNGIASGAGLLANARGMALQQV